jgi:hypothetical protein
MGSTLVTGGDYTVELDTGEIEDGFTLGDSTRGVLGSTTYVLTGTTTFTDVSELVTSLQIRRGRRKIKDQFVAGSVQIALFDNSNRDLDPYNENSAFFNSERRDLRVSSRDDPRSCGGRLGNESRHNGEPGYHTRRISDRERNERPRLSTEDRTKSRVRSSLYESRR